MSKQILSLNPCNGDNPMPKQTLHCMQSIITLLVVVAISLPTMNAYDGKIDQKMADNNTVTLYYNIDKTVSPNEIEITYASTSYGSYTCEDLEIPTEIRLYAVTKIGESAFRNCTNLKSISLPPTIKSIGSYAFQGASNLELIKIPASVTSIGSSAFYNCTKLKHVTNLSSSFTLSKGSSAYGYVGYYAETVINKSNGKVVGDFLFVDDVLEAYMGTSDNIELPQSLDGGDYKVGPYSFYRNRTVTSVKFPPHAKYISKTAFHYNYKLSVIYIDSDLYQYDSQSEYYPKSSFYSDSPVRKAVTYGNNARNIYGKVLSSCNVKSIVICEGVTYLYKEAFNGTHPDELSIPSSLQSAYSGLSGCHPKRLSLGEGITSSWIDKACIDENEYYSVSLELEYVKFPSTLDPRQSDIFDNLLFNCPRVSIDENNPYAKMVNGVLMDQAGTRILKVTPDAPCNFVVPQNVEVYTNAFVRNRIVTSISGLKSNYVNLLDCTSLISATVDAKVLEVHNCLVLSELNWTGGTNIGGRSFTNNPSLKTLYVPSTMSAIRRDWVSGPDTIYMLPTTPPSGYYYDDYYEEDMSHNITPYGCKVLVPPGCADLYNSTDYWKGVEEYDGFIRQQPTSVNPSVKVEPSAGATYQWYKFGEKVESEIDLSANSTGTYPWVKKNGRYVSSNGAIDNSSSTYKETFNVQVGDRIVINWEVSSEANYDNLYIYLNNTEKVKASGINSGVFEYTFESDMAATLEISYKKDGSEKGNNDCAYIHGTIEKKDFTPIQGSTATLLDLMKVEDGDNVLCRVNFPSGTFVNSNGIVISKTAKLYDGTSSVRSVGWTDGIMDANATSANALMIIDQPVVSENLGDNVAGRTSEGALRANTINLTDASPMFTPEDIAADRIIYTRNFKNTNWQPLFVPFAMDYSDWSADFTVAELAGVHMYEDKNAIIEFISVKSGELKPNTPYVIKANNLGEKTITINETIITALPQNGGQISCSSPRWTYTMKGTYQTISRINSADYVMSGGSFGHTSGGLNGFRFYLVKSKSNNGYWGAPALEDEDEVIYIMVDGEVCGIAEAEYVEEEAEGVYYNLNGRVVNNPEHGIYIYKGKKILIK